MSFVKDRIGADLVRLRFFTYAKLSKNTHVPLCVFALLG